MRVCVFLKTCRNCKSGKEVGGKKKVVAPKLKSEKNETKLGREKETKDKEGGSEGKKMGRGVLY